MKSGMVALGMLLGRRWYCSSSRSAHRVLQDIDHILERELLLMKSPILHSPKAIVLLVPSVMSRTLMEAAGSLRPTPLAMIEKIPGDVPGKPRADRSHPTEPQ